MLPTIMPEASHIHYYKNGVRSKEPIKIKEGDKIYEKYKRLFKGVKS